MDGIAPTGRVAVAAVRLLLATPASLTGRLVYHHDVLFPGHPPRGWIG